MSSEPTTPVDPKPIEPKPARQPRSPQDKQQAREIAATGQSIRAVAADAREDPVIGAALTQGGFPLTELQRAGDLHEDAQATLAEHLAVEAIKDEANKTYAAAEKSLTTDYLNLRGLSRSAYLKDRAALENLGISGNAPRSLADLITASELLIRNAPLPLYVAKLTARGVTPARLTALQTRLAALEEADRVQEKALKDVPPVVARRNAAAAALNAWFVEFKAFAKVQFKDRPDLLKRWGLKK
jgi:hypothetical protein